MYHSDLELITQALKGVMTPALASSLDELGSALIERDRFQEGLETIIGSHMVNHRPNTLEDAREVASKHLNPQSK